jgi:hypothetical protein
MERDQTEGTARVDQLPLFDQLLHGIGQVAQQQAALEFDLRSVRDSLNFWGPRDEKPAKERGISDLVDACKKLLAATFTADDELIAAGRGALQAAKDADEGRHRAVHDMWGSVAGEPDVFSRVRTIRESPGIEFHQHDLSYISDIKAVLLRARIRVQTLGWEIAEAQHEYFQQITPPEARHDEWGLAWSLLPVVRGEFELDDTQDAGYRLLGDLPPRVRRSPV